MLLIAPCCFLEQIAAAFFHDAGSLIRYETGYGIRITQQDAGLQFLFG